MWLEIRGPELHQTCVNSQQLYSLQVVGASWEGLKQVAADVTQTVSDGVVAFAQGVGNLVAPLYEDEEDE